jgi:CheY-like chemotaxis protein
MDLEMPVMDGMTCARKIRELEMEGTIIQHIPIIAVTAYARPEQIANAKAAGIVSSRDTWKHLGKGARANPSVFPGRRDFQALPNPRPDAENRRTG